MKAIKLLFTALGLGIALQLSAQSDEEEYAALVSGDVDKFLETFQPMTEDFEVIKDKLNENGELDETQAAYNETGDMSELRALYNEPEVKAVFAKYGWDEQYYGKMQTIVTGLGVVYLEKEMEKRADELTAEEKAMMQRMYDNQEKKVDDASLSMIEAKADELMVLFEMNQE